MMRERED